MRLLKRDGNGEIVLTRDLHGDEIPPYAILSHTWGADGDEVLLSDVADGSATSKAGYAKLQFCATQAQKDGLDHFWIDTCCIDKTNSTELNEAIISMFRWYREARKCYVYLTDVPLDGVTEASELDRPWEAAFLCSRWFTRGWTLQELLAPKIVQFFSADGFPLGDRSQLEDLIHKVTRIPLAALSGVPLSAFSMDDRLRWVATRQTKKPEDKAYCMFGICDVSTVPLYGEGEEKAFSRLRKKIDNMFHPRSATSASVVSPAYGPNDFDYIHNSPWEPRNIDRITRMNTLRFDQIDSREATVKDAQTATCEWLIQHRVFAAWYNATETWTDGGILWIYGKPGAGKSTLMKHALQVVRQKQRSDESIVSFFFNARGSELEKSTSGLFRSLLLQLLQTRPQLQEVLDGEDSVEWTMERLSRLLTRAILMLGPGRLTCFIDALDECDEQEVRQMVDFFEELGDTLLDAQHTKLSICVASRYYPSIRAHEDWEIRLDAEQGHEHDILKYITTHLRIGNPTSNSAKRLRGRIIDKANGIFMWAVLVVRMLNKEVARGRKFALQETLHEIPAALSDVFRGLVSRKDGNMDELILCLQWVLFSARPLTSEEFYFAMLSGLKHDDPAWRPHLWDPDEITVEDMGQFVSSSSRGLAEVTKTKYPTVQLIHESVRDFLLKDGGFHQLAAGTGHSITASAHDRLKVCCNDYLRLDFSGEITACTAVERPSDHLARDNKRVLARAPFLFYAHQYVFYHAERAVLEVPQAQFLSTFDLSTYVSVSNRFKRHPGDALPDKGDLVYTLASRNCAHLIVELGITGLGRFAPGALYDYPLLAAYFLGHRAAVRALLKLETEDLAQRVLHDHGFGNTWHGNVGPISKEGVLSLQQLVFRKHWGLIQCLTRLGAFHALSLNETLMKAVQWALYHGQPKVLQMLLAEADPEDVPKIARISLVQGAALGRSSIVQMILRWSTQPSGLHALSGDNANDNTFKSGETRQTQPSFEITCLEALLHGLLAAEDNAVALLLVHSQMRTWQHHGGMILIEACLRGQSSIVQMLLEKGVNPDTANSNGPALLHAVSKGREKVVALLLRYGADANGRNIKLEVPDLWAYWSNYDPNILATSPTEDQRWSSQRKLFQSLSPLTRAVLNGSRKITELLLKSNAQVDIHDADGKTPLMHAVAAWSECKLDTILLEHGAALDAVDHAGHDVPWHMAKGGQVWLDFFIGQLRSGRWSDSGRSGNDALLQNCLRLTISKDDVDMVRTLLDHGANASATFTDSSTPLIVAALYNAVRVASVLLSKEADPDVLDSNGKSALFHAVRDRRLEMARVLLKAGANARTINLVHVFDMLDPLWTSQPVRGEELVGVETVRRLLDQGANVNGDDCSEITPVAWAVKNGPGELMKLLLDHGADVRNIQEGDTP